MRRMLVALAATVATVAALLPAAAAGGLNCEADDASVRFVAGSGVSRGMGGAFFGFRAELEIRLDGVPADLARLALDGDALVHSWLDGAEVRLHLYHERAEGNFASVDFTLITVLQDEEEGEYAGSYRLRVFAPESERAEEGGLSAGGRATCFAE